MSRFEYPVDEPKLEIITEEKIWPEQLEPPKNHGGAESEVTNFIINTMDNKKDGFYVEIGSQHPEYNNTTYELEKQFDWSGVAIDISPFWAKYYSERRKNPCIEYDATLFDYKDYFVKNNFPKQIDFLQIDVDLIPRAVALKTLIQLPLNEYRFSVIYYEHGYSHDIRESFNRDAARYLLDALGYRLVIEGHMDDLWVDPSQIHISKYSGLFGKTSLPRNFEN